ncbi:AVAST type 5 anti-phage protein Avs5 [Roseateles puraquae]|uniref:Uncharacterized protein n=1 Tax=Roseateles puraquae TaxID=431059 RepID=A0A254NGX4_9BURK|nr:AVAST type 5 anti-phage protein Avs5 [Roseateles puraquae]MDG0857636.1 hypothetical protein [Roseateles puraquae]OWR04528.1 hypothetical protein CDO81_08045 [Roseateles puraquae]
MKSIDEIHFTDPRATQEIQTLFKGSRLIPFFGSGFTRNEKASKGRVPDATELTKEITKIASSKPGISEEQRQQILAIKALKSAFSLLSTPDYISTKQAQTLLGNIFYKVEIASHDKRAILHLDWPHIFTFNIDDAIERTTNKYEKLRPNKVTSREYISANQCLFKIHGDIKDFVATEDTNLIFTWRDYAHSIASNKALLGFLSDQAKTSAFLFVGCSLDAELDLIHLTRDTPFSKSIYLKKGKTSVEDRLNLANYGISRVIYFDNYDEIYHWLRITLSGIHRDAPVRELAFDDAVLPRGTAIELIANGGPIYRLVDQRRVAVASETFARRTVIDDARRLLRDNDCLLVTGRRFSGKTLFLFQLMLAMQEFGAKFFGSSDSYTPLIGRQIDNLENCLFVFDSNHLDSESLTEVLESKLAASSRLVLCASAGDAERVRAKLGERSVPFAEVQISNYLNPTEIKQFNLQLAKSGLPIINNKENLINFAFRCHEEFKGQLPTSTLFNQRFSGETYLVLILLVAFGKASLEQIACVSENFDVAGFVSKNDRVFEIEITKTGDRVLVCSATLWLLKIIHDFVKSNEFAHKAVSDVIRGLERHGFSSHAKDLLRIDKINEISGGHRSRVFIKRIYEGISDIYALEPHYWLQRAKAELMFGIKLQEITEGVGHARKVRLDTQKRKNQTYFSATLVLAQLYARAYKISGDERYLIDFIAPCAESIDNYDNNRRHVDEIRTVDDVKKVVARLAANPPSQTLPLKSDLQNILNFFGGNWGKTNPRHNRRG